MNETMTPAQELRAAATTIRETAASAVAGPWSMRDAWRPGDETVHVARIANDKHEDVLTTRAGADIVGLPGTFEHIALWQPDVADIVADWLVSAAAIAEQGKDPSCVHRPIPHAALALARAINGGAA